MSSGRVGFGHDRASVRGGGKGAGAGLRILIPGYPQWAWPRRERALGLFGSCLVAVGVGRFAGGTPIRTAALACAHGTHVATAPHAARERASRPFRRWVPTFS